MFGNGRTYGAATRSLDLNDPKNLPLQPNDREQTALERFLRREDVNGLAGAATIEPDFVPIDFLLVKEQATTFDEALDSMRWADKICTLVSVQTRRVKNPQFLKVRQ